MPFSTAIVTDALGWGLGAMSVVGSLYALVAADSARRFFAPPSAAVAAGAMAVTVLKPLHGAEPGLADRLRALATQDYDGPVQMVCGVQAADDPAIAVVRALAAELTAAGSSVRLDLVIDPTRHGANAKISNVINMMTVARHEVLVLADSDIAVAPDYLARVCGALAAPGVGLVTCLYRGEPVDAASFWQDQAARAVDHHFLPNVLVGLRLGMAKPCFGSTIALTADTLGRIGGFPAFRDILADDHAIGMAVRGLGLTVAVPPFVVGHLAPESRLGAVLDHELRWARTIRGLDPGGYAGSVVTHPVPLALLGAIFAGWHAWSLLLLGLAIIARLVLQVTIDARITRSRPRWPGLIRDVLSFLVFVASFGIRRVSWRGQRFSVKSDGTMVPVGENGGS
ncbi:bacteriohopanetetrol glucosamine biosynthesis glycosyltransferase HpnI [Nitrospirillum iridis]|uniref:Ceramide glucosyltransferase n=1 Tax=Nitrospirillum iridis TaxID=765888 RepID=A0A7X0AZ77_9PROT|nr:bacteriohopanetetrol glucosamine biosynthesis glycosyltransferase HpnI [Nitrospirillum iridis]MBB6252755.1 ceramide glucosyltransferase [Nitrospirillum iridis]